jgi:hypothetical protein
MEGKMKLTLMGLIVFLPFLLFSQNYWFNCDSGNCGKVEGQIYDAETQKPINEAFDVLFYQNNTDQIKMHERSFYQLYFFPTDQNGCFSFDIPQGEYFIRFIPKNFSSKYCFDPVPVLNPGSRQAIKVIKNKITYFKKMTRLGGIIHITLVDRNNNKILPNTLFNSKDFMHLFLSSKNVEWDFSGEGSLGDDLVDGEITVNRLFPEVYDININFDNVGFGNQRARNILVEPGKTTEVKILVDIDDKTGISGKITDENGNPLVGAEVYINSIDTIVYLESDEGEIYTDKSGNYKIIGMKPNKYQIQVYYRKDEIERCYKGEIEIRNGLLAQKNIVLNESSKCEKFDERI